MSADAGTRGIAPTLARIESEPFYQAIHDEVALFESAHRRRLPVLLKGPTGCGKTRFVEYMAWRLKRPLVTVACHDDLTTADLVGRYLIIGNETVWVDGPLTAAVRAGAICYLDEIVEARKDTTVVIHPLADARRILAVDKRGELVAAPDDFMLVVSYNPGYQSVLKEIKPSTRQRFVALDFDYPEAAVEAGIVATEGGVDAETARRLVKLAELTRNLKGAGLDEGASTRLLVHAAQLIADGVQPATACTAAVARALTDDPDMTGTLDEVLFASTSHRSAKGIADGLERLRREEQERVLHWVGVAAQSYAEIGYLVAALAPRALERLDASGFETWVLAGLDAYDRQGGQAAMALLRDLDGFCAVRENAPAAARLADVETRLARFLHGLAGRPLALTAGAVAHTDTETVFLPAQLAALPTTADNRRLYKATAALLWAQTRYGTFGSATEDLEASLARWPDRERALRWYAALEAVRLEARLGAELPGLAAEIAALRGPWPEALHEAVRRLGRADAAVSHSLTFLDECMAGGAEPPPLPHVGVIDIEAALRVRAARIARESETVRRALSALKGFGGRQGAGEEAAAVNVEGGKVEFSLDGEVAALPPEARAAAQSLLQDLGELPPECLVPAGPGAWQPTLREGSEGGADALTSHREPHRRYDEWDYHRRAYRRGWCHLFEVALAPGDEDYVAKVSLRNAALIRQIRRRFEMLRGEDRLLGRQPEGEEVDVDALVEAAGDRASGAEPSARLFCRRIRNQRSLAAMFMVDMSGSTKGWVNDAERESLVMLCEALETLGDAYAIYGFSGWTRTRCDIYPVKRFDERYDAAVRGRIAAIEAKDYTRMGVAIRHLTQLLEAQPARHKLLVTLSDGRPDDFGDEYRGHYGIEDTRRALQEAHERGVRSFCVTIDRHGADYLPRLYGPARYTVLDDVKKLPLKVSDIYRRLTT